MFGYTVPLFSRMPAPERTDYQRYYCETCHQLKAGYGLVSTAAVNYDMTFNTIVLNAVAGDVQDFRGTRAGPACVLRAPGADSDLFRRMAAYTVLLTKWEIEDDRTDAPSLKTQFIGLTLERAISKAEENEPGFDRTVGDGFRRLRELEIGECSDAAAIGEEFGRYLVKPLAEIAGDADFPELDELFIRLTQAIYVMDAVDDLEEDYTDGTFNPFLVGCPRFINRDVYVKENLYTLASTLNGIIGKLQAAYSDVRPRMKSMRGAADNIVYLGIPEAAKDALAGRKTAKPSVKNALDRRKDRTSTY